MSASSPDPRRGTARLPEAFSVLVLLSLSCSSACRSVDRSAVLESLRLADFVAHQHLNLSTDLISAPHRSGLRQLDYGWRLEPGDSPAESYLALTEAVGRMHLFSADGDLAALDLEMGLAPGADRPPASVLVKLNGDRLRSLQLGREWRRYRLALRDGLVQPGVNHLEVQLRGRRSSRNRAAAPAVQLRLLRAQSASGRASWTERPDTIGVDREASGSTVGAVIEMPTASYLDMVLRVPPRGRLVGRFTVDRPPGADHRPVYVYIQLLDRRRHDLTLYHRRSGTAIGRPRRLDLDLEPWEGELIRLRFGITGAGNALLRWQGVQVATSEAGDHLAAWRPIARLAPPRSGSLGRPDVLVLLLDAARADAFSPLGGPHETPHVERLASDGTLFAEALSPSSWTGESVPAILTGLFPDSLHAGGWGRRLPEQVPVLATLMRAAGYRTVLWSQHPLYQNHASTRRGFEEYHQSAPGAYQTLPEVDILVDDQRPTFSFVHLIPPHAPYRPPAPFSGAFSREPSTETPIDPAWLNQFPRSTVPDSLRAEQVQYIRERYLENVAFADHLVGRLVGRLEDADRYEESLIVLLSDHGEAFLEHGTFLHTRNVHRELLHVPLIFKWPVSKAGFRSRIDDAVSLVDLVPTLVDGLSLPSDGEGFQGRTLLPTAFEDRSRPPRLYAATRGVSDPRQPPRSELMLQDGLWRILYDPLSQRSRLYHIERDPQETEDLADRLLLRALLLRQQVLAQSASNQRLLDADDTTDEPELLDPEVEQELKALGHLN